MLRYFFTVKKFWEYRHKLKLYFVDHNKTLSELSELKTDYLKKNNIKVLVLDFDGVLNSHGENIVKEKIFAWLKNIIVTIPDIKIYIFTNKPNKTRQEYFLQYFSNINFIMNVRKKPYPDALQQIITTLNNNTQNKIINENSSETIKNQEILLIDDRLATGILAAEIFGCKALLITKPYINYKNKPCIEFFFTILRFAERIVIKLIC